MKVISLGVGRTGTNSLKIALNALGVGPCHHMVEVIGDIENQTPLWQSAVEGNPDWPAIYHGFCSAVDWPTAGFAKELYSAFPDAKYILSVRSTESWVESFSNTIYASLANGEQMPAEMQQWHRMVCKVIAKTGFPFGLSADELAQRYEAHNEMVRTLIPEPQLLTFEAKHGWQPLCEHLAVPIPDTPYPRTNSRAEFWERMGTAETDRENLNTKFQ